MFQPLRRGMPSFLCSSLELIRMYDVTELGLSSLPQQSRSKNTPQVVGGITKTNSNINTKIDWSQERVVRVVPT